MPDKTFWPFWLQFLKHAVMFILVAGAGIHAYYRHVQEAVSPVSRRKWMFWIYAAVFMAAGAAVFAQLCIFSTFRESTDDSSTHLGYGMILILLSYLAFLMGVKRKN